MGVQWTGGACVLEAFAMAIRRCVNALWTCGACVLGAFTVGPRRRILHLIGLKSHSGAELLAVHLCLGDT
jgi:hypothetical protein